MSSPPIENFLATVLLLPLTEAAFVCWLAVASVAILAREPVPPPVLARIFEPVPVLVSTSSRVARWGAAFARAISPAGG